MDKEQWRAVGGYEGIYEVSDCGHVRSLDREVEHGRYGTQRLKGQELSPGDNGHGYLAVYLHRHGRGQKARVHRLVLQAFAGEQPSKNMECNHLDGDKANNQIDNLEWVTKGENLRHAYDNGLRPNRAKLTPELAKMLRQIYATGTLTQSQVGLMFGIVSNTVSKIVRGETWPDAGGPITKFGQLTNPIGQAEEEGT